MSDKKYGDPVFGKTLAELKALVPLTGTLDGISFDGPAKKCSAILIAAGSLGELVADVEMLQAERDELARWKELVSNGSPLQALRDKAERERDQLLEAAKHILAILQHPTKSVNIFDQEKLEEAVAKVTTTGPIYTSISKGGSYTKLGTIRGAGALKGLAGIAYQNDKGDLFVREPECFAKRMVLVEQKGGAE